MCAAPTAPAWLQRAGLEANVMGKGPQQRGSEGGGGLMLRAKSSHVRLTAAASVPRRRDVAGAMARAMVADFSCRMGGPPPMATN